MNRGLFGLVIDMIGFSTSYVEAYGLEGPSDDIHFVLEKIATKLHAKDSDGNWNTNHAARHFLNKFRQGDLGKFTLDNIPISK